MKIRPFHVQRPLAACAAAWGAGIGMGIFLPWRPVLYGAGLLLSGLLCVFLPGAGRRRITGVLTALLFCGMLWAGLQAHPALPPEGDCAVLSAVASGDFTLREDGSAAGYLENVQCAGNTRLRRVYCTYTPDDPALPLPREGDSLSFTAYLYHPAGQSNPYGFDFRLFLLQRGVHVGLSRVQALEITGHPGRGLFSFFYHTRKAAEDKLHLIFGEDSALPESLLLGVKENLPEETQTAFTRAGAAHILSVSGLHVGLLAGALSLLLRKLCSPRKRIYILCGFLLMYSALLDFAAPVVRASVLLMLTQLRSLLRCPPDLLTALSAAFLLILLFSPLSLLSASFVLSFGAVLGITLFGKGIARRLRFMRCSFLEDGFSVSLSATLGILLPSVYYFHRFSLIGLFINPLVCAVFGALLPLYALTLLCGMIWLPLGQILAVPLKLAGRYVVQGLALCSELPFAAVNLPTPPDFVILGLLLSAGMLCRFCVWPKRRKRVVAALTAILSLALWGVTQNRDVQYIQLFMGQADSAIITDSREATLIDAGEYGGDAAAYLLSTGRKADRVILTHLHEDHCLGLEKLMEEEVPIGEVYLPQDAEELAVSEDCLSILTALRQKGVPIRYLSAGDVLSTPRTRMTVLWPKKGSIHPGADPNSYSLVTLWDLDGVKLLSAADIPGAYERYAAAEADILKIAHHGSQDSTSSAFLAAVSPGLALITGDRGSRLPGEETLSRLAEADVLVYNTGEWGALTLTLKAGHINLTPYLVKEP